MYIYKVTEHSANYTLYTVGFYDPDGTWYPESDHEDSNSAARKVAYLNGVGIHSEIVSDLIAGYELLQKKLEEGCYLAKQDGEWWLFDKLGEGINGGRYIKNVMLNLVRGGAE